MDMDISTETLGLKWGAALSLENADELIKEVSDKAEDIMKRAFAEFNDFLEKKGLENRMGVLCPRDDVKAIYHITDIEWDFDDEDDYENNLPTSIDAEDVTEDIKDYLFDNYYYCVKSYKLSVEIIKPDEDVRIEKFKKALFAAGSEAVEAFCDITFSGYESDEMLETLVDDIIAQMPDDVFDSYYEQYVKETH